MPLGHGLGQLPDWPLGNPLQEVGGGVTAQPVPVAPSVLTAHGVGPEDSRLEGSREPQSPEAELR